MRILFSAGRAAAAPGTVHQEWVAWVGNAVERYSTQLRGNGHGCSVRCGWGFVIMKEAYQYSISQNGWWALAWEERRHTMNPVVPPG